MCEVSIILKLDKNKGGDNIFLESYRIFKHLENYIKKNIDKFQDRNMIKSLSEKSSEFIMEDLLKYNQYIYVDEESRERLKNFFINEYKSIVKGNSNFVEMENRLKELLLENYEVRLLDSRSAKFRNIPCSQYSAKKQIEVLNINIDKLGGKIIDLGCGKDANLVKYLRSHNLEAFGIDRYKFKDPYLENISWLDFNFKNNYYGGIIAHMSFSNHFKREFLKSGNLLNEYKYKYLEILKSLKKNASFYYSPSLSFMEDKIDLNNYSIEYNDLYNGMKSVKIKKLL